MVGDEGFGAGARLLDRNCQKPFCFCFNATQNPHVKGLTKIGCQYVYKHTIIWEGLLEEFYLNLFSQGIKKKFPLTKSDSSTAIAEEGI